MINEKDLKDTGFKLDNIIEDKDSPFDEENTMQVRIWAKQKNELKIEVTFGARRGGLEEPFWVDFEQSVELCICDGRQELRHIKKTQELRLLLFALKM